jgi:hypothetical protein
MRSLAKCLLFVASSEAKEATHLEAAQRTFPDFGFKVTRKPLLGSRHWQGQSASKLDLPEPQALGGSSQWLIQRQLSVLVCRNISNKSADLSND